MLFTQEHCRIEFVSGLPPLKTELLDWSYPEQETKKERECAQTKSRQASVYVSEIERSIVYSEQRKRKKKRQEELSRQERVPRWRRGVRRSRRSEVKNKNQGEVQ